MANEIREELSEPGLEAELTARDHRSCLVPRSGAEMAMLRQQQKIIPQKPQFINSPNTIDHIHFIKAHRELRAGVMAKANPAQPDDDDDDDEPLKVTTHSHRDLLPATFFLVRGVAVGGQLWDFQVSDHSPHHRCFKVTMVVDQSTVAVYICV